MSILGKLLIVFNLLAAGAFAYFALENWHLRQDLTWTAFDRQVKLNGLSVEPAAAPADLTDDRVAFSFQMPDGGPHYNSIPKSRFDNLIPKGDATYGGGPVADQTAEIKRLQQKVQELIAAAGNQNPANGAAELRGYLLNIARTGAERDGINGLFDQLDPNRRNAARKDVSLLGRTSTQVAALTLLEAISSLQDPQAIMPESARTTRIGDAREAVKRFLRGEIFHGLPPGTKEGDDAERALRNAVEAVLADGAGEEAKKGLAEKATADAAGWTELANVAVEPLTDKPSVDRAIESLTKFVKSKAATPAEAAALEGIRNLLHPPALNFALDRTVTETATNLLNSKFEEAALPTGANEKRSRGEKARQIAHILYHIDAHRHANRTPEVAAERKAWHERVATVVGLPEYIRAAEAQANEYAEASQRLISVITEEQSTFEAEYQALQQKVRNLYAQWLAKDAELKVQEAITKENVRLKDERLTERDDLRMKLDKATEDAKAALQKLQATQARLFAIQRDLRDAQTAILSLEKELRRLELGPDRKVDAIGR